MPVYCDVSHNLHDPFSRLPTTDIEWSHIDHLLPSIQHCEFDRFGIYLALFLNGGVVQLCDVSCGIVIPQTHFIIPNADRTVCQSIVWSNDAKFLTISLSKRNRSMDGRADHEIIVWDILGKCISQRIASLYPIKSLETIPDAHYLLCKVAPSSSHLLGILDLSIQSLKVVKWQGEALVLQEIDWVSPSTDQTTSSSSSSSSTSLSMLLQDGYMVHSFICRREERTVADKRTREVIAVMQRVGAAQPTLSLLSIDIHDLDQAVNVYHWFPLEPCRREQIILSQKADLLLLASPAFCFYGIYHLNEQLQEAPQRLFQFPISPMLRDSSCIAASIVRVDKQLIVVVSLQQTSRHTPCNRLLLWTAPPILTTTTIAAASSSLITLRSPGVVLSSMAISRGNLFALDSYGKARFLSMDHVSDFAGAMYPVGYVLLQQIRTYEEREDELDKVITSMLCQPVESASSLMEVGHAAATAAAASAALGMELEMMPSDELPTSSSSVSYPVDYLRALPFSVISLSRADLRSATVPLPSASSAVTRTKPEKGRGRHLRKAAASSSMSIASPPPGSTGIDMNDLTATAEQQPILILSPIEPMMDVVLEDNDDNMAVANASAATPLVLEEEPLQKKSTFSLTLQSILPVPNRILAGESDANFTR